MAIYHVTPSTSNAPWLQHLPLLLPPLTCTPRSALVTRRWIERQWNSLDRLSRGSITSKEVKLFLQRVNLKLGAKEIKDSFNQVCHAEGRIVWAVGILCYFTFCTKLIDFVGVLITIPYCTIPYHTIPYPQVDKFKNGVIGLASFIELYHNLQDIRLLNEEFKPYSTDVSKYALFSAVDCIL